MYKRPNPRPFRTGCCGVSKKPVVIPDGLVGDIMAKMRISGPYHPPPPAWTPSIEYNLIATHMGPSEREAYITRCERWFNDNPSLRVDPVESDESLFDPEPILAVLTKYWPNRPPISEYVTAMGASGYSAARIQKAVNFDKKMKSTYEKRTADLDLIFARWPAASKPTPKANTRAIKAVKKKMT